MDSCPLSLKLRGPLNWQLSSKHGLIPRPIETCSSNYSFPLKTSLQSDQVVICSLRVLFLHIAGSAGGLQKYLSAWWQHNLALSPMQEGIPLPEKWVWLVFPWTIIGLSKVKSLHTVQVSVSSFVKFLYRGNCFPFRRYLYSTDVRFDIPSLSGPRLREMMSTSAS